MEISFNTKQESKLMQQKEFLALSPVERFYKFLELMEKSAALFPIKTKKQESKNFVIVIASKN